VNIYLQEMQQKRAAEARNSVPAKSAAEAVHRMLTKKVIDMDNKGSLCKLLLFWFAITKAAN